MRRTLRVSLPADGALAPFSFFNDTATTEIYTLSLHDALPISGGGADVAARLMGQLAERLGRPFVIRSEEHTSELQPPCNLVCRLLLEKKKSTALRAVAGNRPAEGKRTGLQAVLGAAVQIDPQLGSLQPSVVFFFFFNDTATPEIYTLSLHDALPISADPSARPGDDRDPAGAQATWRRPD